MCPKEFKFEEKAQVRLPSDSSVPGTAVMVWDMSFVPEPIRTAAFELFSNVLKFIAPSIRISREGNRIIARIENDENLIANRSLPADALSKARELTGGATPRVPQVIPIQPVTPTPEQRRILQQTNVTAYTHTETPGVQKTVQKPVASKEETSPEMRRLREAAREAEMKEAERKRILERIKEITEAMKKPTVTPIELGRLMKEYSQLLKELAALG